MLYRTVPLYTFCKNLQRAIAFRDRCMVREICHQSALVLHQRSYLTMAKTDHEEEIQIYHPDQGLTVSAVLVDYNLDVRQNRPCNPHLPYRWIHRKTKD